MGVYTKTEGMNERQRKEYYRRLRKQYARRSREKRADAIREYEREYRIKNREGLNEKKRIRYAEDTECRERVRIYNAKYRNNMTESESKAQLKFEQKEVTSDHLRIVGEQLKYQHIRLTEAKKTKNEHVKLGAEIQKLMKIKSTAMSLNLSKALQRVEQELKPLLFQYQTRYDADNLKMKSFANV